MLQAESVTGRNLDNFFEVFFREVQFPVLIVDRLSDTCRFTWQTETNVPLDLNVPILVNGTPDTVIMNNSEGFVIISMSDSLVIDPLQRILMRKPLVTGSRQAGLNTSPHFMLRNYPNPFSQSTTIAFTLPAPGYAKLTVTDYLGRTVKTPVNEYLYPGLHRIRFSAGELQPGTYFYTLYANGIYESGKMSIAE